MELDEPYVLVRSRNNGHLRRSDDAQVLGLDEGRVIICFGGGKEYSYSTDNALIIAREEQWDIDDYDVLRKGDKKIFGGMLSVKYLSGPCGDAWEILFSKGTPRYYSGDEIVLRKRLLSSSPYKYLRAVAEKTKPNGKYADYLTNQFKYMKREKETALVPFLSLSPLQDVPSKSDTPIIYPFDCNQSQMGAVRVALENQLSVIEGPPGTGKTSTILNIVANLLLRNMTVLVASPNGYATGNVGEKLCENGLGFLIAELGRGKNIDLFLACQDKRELPDGIKNHSWVKTRGELEVLKHEASRLSGELIRAFDFERAISRKRSSLREWKLEYDRFKKDYQSVESPRCKKDVTVENAWKIRDYLTRCSLEGKRISFVRKATFSYLYRVGTWEFYSSSLPADLEMSFNRFIFETEISHLSEEIADDERRLESYKVNEIKSRLSWASHAILRAFLYEKYVSSLNGERKRFCKNDLKNMREFVTEYPIVTTTTNAAKKQQGVGDGFVLYDYLIVDEGSQVNLITGVLALTCARNAVIVGDTKQLPCVISAQDEDAARSVEEEISPGDDRFIFHEHSLLSSIVCGMDRKQIADARTILVEHYRCDPLIAEFFNQKFYNGKLIPMRDSCVPAKEVLYIKEIEEHTSRRGDFNRVQAEEFFSAVENLFSDVATKDIGAVVPYRHQADGMQRMLPLSADGDEKIEVETIHKFQGREKRVVAFVTSANRRSRFLDDANLVNVAISRASDKLMLIAQKDVLAGKGNIPDLARYIRYRKGSEVSRTTSSVFDLLYPEHAKELDEWKRTHKKLITGKEPVYSELLFAELLSKVIANQGKNEEIGYVRNYLLKQLFRDISLNGREQKFLDSGAHVDYVLFHLIDRRVLCGIEVNGGKHYSNRGRRSNDALKEGVFRKANVPLYSFATHDVEEENRLIEIFEELGESSKCSNSVSTGFHYVVADDEKEHYRIATGGKN